VSAFNNELMGGFIPVNAIRNRKQESLVKDLLPATINFCKTLGLPVEEAWLIWGGVFGEFIRAPRHVVTYAELTKYILSVVTEH